MVELLLVDPGHAFEGCIGEDAFVVFQEAFHIIFVEEGKVAFEDRGNVLFGVVLLQQPDCIVDRMFCFFD